MRSLFLLCLGAAVMCPLHAEDKMPPPALEKEVLAPATLAKLLQNPLAPLTRVDMENSFDFGIDPYGGERITSNIRLNFPVALSKDWWLLTPSSNPLLYQHGVYDDKHSHEAGMGDMYQSFWISPNNRAAEGFSWGAGTIFLFPFSTEKQIGLRTWATGPEAAVSYQHGPWTYSLLVHHMWSFAGSGDHISETLLIPHCAYVFDDGFAVSARIPVSYEWKKDHWLLPVTLDLSQSFNAFGESFCFGIYGSYYLKTYDKMPDWGVGFRIAWAIP